MEPPAPRRHDAEFKTNWLALGFYERFEQERLLRDEVRLVKSVLDGARP